MNIMKAYKAEKIDTFIFFQLVNDADGLCLQVVDSGGTPVQGGNVLKITHGGFLRFYDDISEDCHLVLTPTNRRIQTEAP